MSGQSGHSSGSSDFNQTIPAWQQDALERLYSSARETMFNTRKDIRRLQPGAENFISGINNMAVPAYKDALAGGVYQNMGNQQMLTDSLNSSLNNPSLTSKLYGQIMGGEGNNYADAMKASYITDANRAQANMLANVDSRAAAAGMSGGSRHGTAIGQGMNDINTNLQRNMAVTGYETFDKDLQNKLGIASMADQNTFGRQQMLSDMIAQQQGVQTGGLNSSQNMQNLGMGMFSPAMMNWQNMSNYANIIGSPDVLSSGQSSSNSKSGGGGL